jgi:hypothetical protein
MEMKIGCDIVNRKEFKHTAKEGIDIDVNTKSKHNVELKIREHGIRLVIDGKLENDTDWEEEQPRKPIARINEEGKA